MILLGIISGLLNLLGVLLYVADVLKRRAQPEQTTWLIWSLVGVIAFLTQRSIGAHASLWFVGLQTLGVMIVALLSIKYGPRIFTKLDAVSLVLAGLGIIIWQTTDSALLGLITVIIVRAIAVVGTVRKTYEHPESESALPWAIFACSAVLAIASVGKFDLGLLLYPMYVIVADFAVMIAKYHKSLKVSKLAAEFANHTNQESRTDT